MPTEKLSLTLEQDVVAQAREAAGARGLSSYVNEAVRKQLQHDQLLALLDQLDEEFGPVPDAVMDEVRAEWPAPDELPRHRRSA
jgi:hypothetical protein